MTPTTLAETILRDVPRYSLTQLGPVEGGQWLHYPDVIRALTAIAKLAEGDDLVERATAALEGVTKGKPCQFHPSYCKEAEGTPFSEWDSSHDLSVILPDGKRYKIGHFRHSADAGFDQFARQWVPKAAARISALTATVDMLHSVIEQLQGPLTVANLTARAEAAEAQIAALTARVEGLTGALHNCVGMLDCLVAESGRSIEWGQEDPFRMGEWFEPEDLAQIKQARAALSAATEQGHE